MNRARSVVLNCSIRSAMSAGCSGSSASVRFIRFPLARAERTTAILSLPIKYDASFELNLLTCVSLSLSICNLQT